MPQGDTVIMELACLLINQLLFEQAAQTREDGWLTRTFVPLIQEAWSSESSTWVSEWELNQHVWETALGIIDDLPLNCSAALRLRSTMALSYNVQALGQQCRQDC